MIKLKNYILPFLVLMALVNYQCEPDHETVNVSSTSELPKFEYDGGQFISFVKGSRDTFIVPDVIATAGDKELEFIRFGSGVNTKKAGVYIYYYFAQNEDNLVAEGRRIIAVTHNDVSERDLSGKYIIPDTYGWGTAEARVKKLNNNGWYSCSEVMGYADAEMKGEFVDIGNNELYLLPGEGYFGDYDIDKGSYTFTSLSWSVYLLDDPYYGTEIPVTLIKDDE